MLPANLFTDKIKKIFPATTHGQQGIFLYDYLLRASSSDDVKGKASGVIVFISTY